MKGTSYSLQQIRSFFRITREGTGKYLLTDTRNGKKGYSHNTLAYDRIFSDASSPKYVEMGYTEKGAYMAMIQEAFN